MNFRKLVVRGAIAACVVLSGSCAIAQDFPSRLIKFVVPFPPGSGTDTSARYFGRKLTELTGQPVIVENRAGANGFLAVKQVLAAPADGYTVFVGSNSTLAVNVALFKKLPSAPLDVPMDGIEMVTVNPQSGQRTEAQCTGARQLPFMAGFAPTETDHCVMQEIRSIFSGTP